MMTKEQKSKALWEAARGLKTKKGYHISAIAKELRMTKKTVISILDMQETYTSFEFAKVANYLLGDAWLSWEDENKPFIATIKKRIVLGRVPNFEPKKMTIPILKQIPTNSPKALDTRDQFCVTKGHEHREAMSCHYTGLGQSELGCGTGCKGDSLLTAWLCSECHTKFDQYTTSEGIMYYPEKVLHSFLFLTAIAKTLLKKKALGRIKEI